MPLKRTTSRPIVIGVAGRSGSGKTTVVREIIRGPEPNDVGVIEHDSYYYDRSDVPRFDNSRWCGKPRCSGYVPYQGEGDRARLAGESGNKCLKQTLNTERQYQRYSSRYNPLDPEQPYLPHGCIVIAHVCGL